MIESNATTVSAKPIAHNETGNEIRDAALFDQFCTPWPLSPYPYRRLGMPRIPKTVPQTNPSFRLVSPGTYKLPLAKWKLGTAAALDRMVLPSTGEFWLLVLDSVLASLPSVTWTVRCFWLPPGVLCGRCCSVGEEDRQDGVPRLPLAPEQLTTALLIAPCEPRQALTQPSLFL